MKSSRHITAMLVLALWPMAAQAQVEVTFFDENFDGVEAPELPEGWVPAGAGWETSTGVPSTQGSGGNNLYVGGNAQDAIATPELDLSRAATATVSYLARRTSTYEADSFCVVASIDGGVTFADTLLASGAALPPSTSTYDSVGVVVPPALLVDGFVLRFEALGGETGGANVRIDDVRVSGEASVLLVEPEALAFLVAPGREQQQVVTATNHTGGSVTVEAPQLGGTAYSVVPAGSVVLPDGASQVYTVTFAPASEGAYEEVMTLPYDDHAAAVAFDGTALPSELGFASASDTALAEAEDVAVALRLQQAAPEGLHGLQFKVTWSDPLVEDVTVEPGAAVADPDAWTLSVERGAGSVEVLLVSSGADGLPARHYDALLTLLVDVGDPGGDDATLQLEVEDVIGALATPGADDPELEYGISTHELVVEPPKGLFQLSVTDLDLGYAVAGTTAEAEVIVSNAGGAAPLTITGATSSNGLFTVTPATAVIPQDDDYVFTITFAPTMSQFGDQEGTITFAHDGVAAGGDVLGVVGLGTGGQGDADGDGLVDVVDLVQIIDFILEREAASEQQQASADLFPYPTGDGALDVRDLTVLVQAIVRDQWPDDDPLPVVNSVAGALRVAAAAKAKRSANPPVVLRLTENADEIGIEIEHAQPLRAMQIELDVEVVSAEPQVVLRGEGTEGTAIQVHTDEEGRTVRLLLYRPDGSAWQPGRYPLVVIPTDTPVESVDPLYVVAVDQQRERTAVEVRRAKGTDVEGADELPDRVRVGAVYPQPFRVARGGMLHVPVELPEVSAVRAVVYDVLGRQLVTLPETTRQAGAGLLTWDGRDSRGAHAAPGVYVLRVQVGAEVRTQTLVVVP